MSEKPSLVFICSENSARSVLAEALARQLYSDRFAIYSAGSQPGTVDGRALEALQRQGINQQDLSSKAIKDLPLQQYDYAILLCEKAS